VSPLAKLLALIGGVTALLGVIALAVVAVVGLASDDPLSIFAIPILAFGVIVIVGLVLVLAVIAQGARNLREPLE
jgi:hypothetical protein